MLDCIHVCVFHSRKTGFKKWLDISSTPCYLSSFSSFFLSQSRHLLNTWQIDRESSCLLDSFSTPGGLIKLLFLDLMSCSSIPQLSTTIFSIPISIASSTPLITCIYRALLKVYIYFLRNPFLISSIYPHLFISQSPSLSLQTSSFLIFQAFSRFFFSWEVSNLYSSCISCFETQVLGF